MNTAIKVDFAKKTGKQVQQLHGFNSGPMTKVFTYDARPLFVEGGFPYVRLHDSEYPYGSGEFIDIPCIFKNFDADENDPKSYNFGNTDEYIRQCLNVGSRIIYRLGVSIEHSPVKRYTDPPKDFAKWARICEHIIRHYNEGWADGYHWNIEYWEIWNEPDLDRETDNKRCWSGTAAEFAEFYTVAARHLKSCFPHLKIGGCGFSSVRNFFIEDFFKDISARTPRVPMDFYTWHRYKGVAAAYAEGAAIVRDLLTEYGYGEAESILDEWNMIYGWDRDNQAESYRAMKDHRGAAFYAGVLCVLQEKSDVCTDGFIADRINQTSPLRTVHRQIHVECRIVGNLNLSVLEAKTSHHLPYIAAQIVNACHCMVVRPSGGTCSCQGHSRRTFDQDTFLIGVCVILTEIGVAVGESSVLQAEVCKQAPFLSCHKVPTFTLAEASSCRIIVRDVRPRLHSRKRVGLPVDIAVRIYRDVDLIKILIARFESRMNLRASAFEKVAVANNREASHNRGDTCVIVDNNNLVLDVGFGRFELHKHFFCACFLRIRFHVLIANLHKDCFEKSFISRCFQLCAGHSDFQLCHFIYFLSSFLKFL